VGPDGGQSAERLLPRGGVAGCEREPMTQEAFASLPT
jgi:hypothetical protein